MAQAPNNNKQVIPQLTPVLQIPGVMQRNAGNVPQQVKREAIKVPVVARGPGMPQSVFKTEPQDEPPIKKPKVLATGSSAAAAGVITTPARYPVPALVKIDSQRMPASAPLQMAPRASISSPLFQSGFQTVFLQPSTVPSSPVKSPNNGQSVVATPYMPIVSKTPTLATPPVRMPNVSTNPILMHPGLSNKIVVHAPTSQPATSPPLNSQPLSMSLGQMGATHNQGSPIQAPAVLGSGRLVQVQSAGGTQKYILVPPGTAPHLLNAPQLAVQGSVTAPLVPTSRQEKTLSVINTSQGSVTVQMTQSTPVIVQSSVQSLNKLLPQVPQTKKLPGNVQARYVHKSQLSGSQVSTTTTTAKPPSQNKVITVGQHVGAITNRSATVGKMVAAKAAALFTTPVSKPVPTQSALYKEQTRAPALGSVRPMTLSTGQQSIVLHTGLHTGNFKRILSGTPMIVNLPGSHRKQPQTAILMPPASNKANPQSAQSKVIRTPIPGVPSPKSTQPVTVAVSIQSPNPNNRTISPNVQMALQNKIKLVSCVQASTITSSVVSTQKTVNANTTRSVSVAAPPIMSSTTTLVQNGRLLQLLPARRGPVSASIKPQTKNRGMKRQLCETPPPLIQLKTEEKEQEMSTVDLALRLAAPFPQAYIRRPLKPKQIVTSTAGNAAKPPDDKSTMPKEESVKKEERNEEDIEFTWNEYLEITGTVAAPSHSFKHVDVSLISAVKVGMKVEAPNPPSTLNPFLTYWVASVISVSGELLLLRYEGYGEDRSADFWCDLDTKVLHPVGWCARNGQMLQPPDALLHKKLQWQHFLIASLTGAKTIPENILSGEIGPLPIDKLLKGRYLDVIDEDVPTQAWIASIIENYGGRLKLRYSGAKEGNDFFIFYLSYRLHPPGWAKEHRVIIKPPKVIQQQSPSASDNHWRSMYFGIVAAANLSSALPHDFFKIRKAFSKIKVNNMKEGMKLEAVNPRAPHQICPATITKNFNSHFFQVQIDNVERSGVEKEKIMFVCHAESGGIFPTNWCKENGVSITPPKGYGRPKFKWSEYLKSTDSKPAPSELFRTATERKFQNGMKLEAVWPFNSSIICVATITKIAGRHIWLHFDGSKQPNHIVDAESQDIFPVGWCDSVGFPLKSPKRLMAQKKKVAIVCPAKRIVTSDPTTGRDLYQRVKDAVQYEDSEGWMPKVYINHKCFSGPYLNKRRLAELPQSTGPGMVTLVLREVLGSLINSAYKPNKVLREFQVQNEVTAGQNGYLQIMKAKYKGKSFRALVELPKTVPKVLEFLQQTLKKLESCPNLVSLTLSGDECPEKCEVNLKPNYIYNQYGGKRKKKGRNNKPNKKKKMMMIRDMVDKNDEEPDLDEKPPSNGAADPTGVAERKNDAVVVPIKPPVLTPLMTRARHIVQTAKLAKIQHATPRLILPDRKRRGINMMRLTANLRSSRPRKDPSHAKKSSSSKKSHKKAVVEKVKSHEIPSASSGKISPALHLESNPLEWSITEVEEFIKDTDCASLAKVFREQEIDGQALLLLTLPTVQECMELKLGPAIKLCHHIERLKIAFYEQFAK